jgi:type II secretory ATPase GspE/PulE/Tfp pilus assembly ATPase PilB-like protein
MAGPAPQIGRLLEEKGLIRPEQIQFALREQKATGERLGECLIRLGMTTDSELAQVLGEQSGQPFIDLRNFTPDKQVLTRLPVQIARQKQALPLYMQDNQLHVAISDPYDTTILETLFRHIGLPVKINIGAKNELQKLIERFYYLLEHPIEEEVEGITQRLRQNPNLDIDSNRLLDMLLSASISYRVTDVHLTPSDISSRVMYRIDGILNFNHVFPISIHNRLITTIKVRSGMDISEQRKPQDGRMSFEFLGDAFDIRVSTVRTNNGENCVMRLLPSKGGMSIGIHELGFEKEQEELLLELFGKPYGMVLVTGPTGSGKTTTLYAALRQQDAISKNILTVEDPIEYSFSLIRQTQVNEKAGYTFGAAIRTFLRQDPDVILVGEIRDEETAILGIRAALTGHLVLSTLHTNTAIGAIARLNDLGISPLLLSNALVGVLAQRLVRRLCPSCKQPYQPDAKTLERYNLPENGTYYKPGKCQLCRNTGYRGRSSIGEILLFNKDMLKLVADNAPPNIIEAEARKHGFKPLWEAGMEKVIKGETTLEEIQRVIT